MKPSKFLILILCLALTLLPVGAYSDLPADSSLAVSTLTALQVISGYPDGTFRPSETLTRGQFCKLVIQLAGWENALSSVQNQTLFDDVPPSHWASSYINLACQKNLVSGYGNGTFGPEDPVTSAQASKILLELLGYSAADVGSFYPDDYLSKAASLGLLNGNTNSDLPLTRGDAAQMLYQLLLAETSSGKTYASTLSAVCKEDLVLLSTDDITFTDGKTISSYTSTITLPAALENRRGSLLLDSKNRVVGFVPDGSQPTSLVVADASADGVTATSGAFYSLEETTPLVLDDELLTYSSAWYSLKSGDTLSIYEDHGAATLVVVSAALTSSGSQLLGRIDSAAPSLTAASSVTLSGCVLPVNDSLRASLASFAIGDVVKVTLDRFGSVCAVSAASGETMVGYAQVSGDRASVTFPGGTISGELSTAAYAASKLSGSLVRVRVDSDGELSLTSLSAQSYSDPLDLSARSFGSAPLAGNVKVYERVSTAPAQEIDLSSLTMDTIPAKSIEYVGFNASGEVDLLLLQNVSGDLYDYGILQKSTKTTGSGSMSVTNTVVTVENASGTTSGYLIGQSFTEDSFGGVAGSDITGKTVSILSLTAHSGLTRADFTSDTLGGFPLAEGLQVYNAATSQWVTLSQAKAYSNSFTAYVDPISFQVRVLVAE